MTPGIAPILSSQEEALAAYYADRRLLKRNILCVLVLTLGWSSCFAFLNPLLQLTLKAAGVGDSTLGMISGANGWIYSYLVMYFSWKSDNTVSRFGRRIPYLMISAPVIILSMALFPLFHVAWVLIAIFMANAIFMDIKAATIPLLNIDCVPRSYLARVNSLMPMVTCVISFLALRYGMRLADYSRVAPFWIGGAVLAVTTVVGVLFIREPPIKQKSGKRFMPWSAMKIAWEDKTVILLMLGVGLIQGVGVTSNAWIWLFANQELGLSRGDMGAAMAWGALVPLLVSFPSGCLIDRFRKMRMVAVYWGLSLLAAWWIVARVHDSLTLSIAAVLLAVSAPFYAAADIKVYRDADPRHIGSVTSTNSCLRGIINGLAVMVSGFLVQRFGGDYRVALIFGTLLATCGFLCIFVYSRLNPKPALPPEAAACG